MSAYERLKRPAIDITADSVIPVPSIGAAAPAEQYAAAATTAGDDDIPFYSARRLGRAVMHSARARCS